MRASVFALRLPSALIGDKKYRYAQDEALFPFLFWETKNFLPSLIEVILSHYDAWRIGFLESACPDALLNFF